jgi:hypothetical protein
VDKRLQEWFTDRAGEGPSDRQEGMWHQSAKVGLGSKGWRERIPTARRTERKRQGEKKTELEGNVHGPSARTQWRVQGCEGGGEQG